VFLAALLTACSHRSIVGIEGSIPVPPDVRAIVFTMQNGILDLVCDAGPSVRYEGQLRRSGDTQELLATVEQIPAVFTAARAPEHPDILIITLPGVGDALRGRAFVATEAVVHMPATLETTVTVAGSGQLKIEDLHAPLHLTTPRGDLTAMRCSGPAQLRTDRGNTLVYDHRGDIDVEAMVGDMQVFVREPGKRIRLVTGEGNVQCFVPPDTGFRLDARAKTGKVANGFGMPLVRDGYTSSMVGDRGDLRTSIVLRAETGHLSLSHKRFE
jgi:hypothetical protein